MEIINFPCVKCGNLMGVTADCLGEEVQCPSCQQVVTAPRAPAERSPVAPAAVGGHDHEDIFAPPVSDDLFGDEAAPRLEMPPPAPSGNGLSQHHEPDLSLDSPPAAPPAPSEPYPGEPAVGTPVADDNRTNPAVDFVPAKVHGDDRYSAPSDELPSGAGSVHRQQRRSNSIMPTLILMSLLSYAILVTIAFVYVFIRLLTPPPNPLDELPDVDGDNPGIRRSPQTWQIKDEFKEPLPDRLKIGLGQKLQVGDLEIEPTSVERKRVVVLEQGKRPEKMEHDSVVLHLHLRNTSAVWTFMPLDPYFDRGMVHSGPVPTRPAAADNAEALAKYRDESNKYWEKWSEKAKPAFPPLTLLEVGERRFFGSSSERHFGSSSDWYDLDDKTMRQQRSWVEGQFSKEQEGKGTLLHPGQEMDTFVSTDGRDPRLDEELKTYSGPMMYRVHFRRGSAHKSNGKLINATAVVGVTFTTSDIKTP
jgi:hypothetical protein